MDYGIAGPGGIDAEDETTRGVLRGIHYGTSASGDDGITARARQHY